MNSDLLIREIRFEQLKLMLDRIHLMMTEPDSYYSWKLVNDDDLMGRTRISSSLRRLIRIRLKRAVSRTTMVINRVTPLRRKKCRIGLYKHREGKYKKGPRVVLEYLRSEFYRGKKYRENKAGEYLLTEEQIDWIFNKSYKRLGKVVTLYEVGNDVLIRRIDSSGDFEMNNILVVIRRRRYRMGVKDCAHARRKRGSPKSKPVRIFDGAKDDHPWR